ncbi:MAG: hypothetical protein ACF8PN_11240 [Phycisphaerales bacterium]
MKKFMLVLLVVIVIGGGIAGWVVFRSVSGQGSSSIEDWIGRSIVGVLESYLNPEVELGQLDYQAPYTVVLDELILTAPTGERMMDVERATLTLAEIPKVGEPVLIERVELERPELAFIVNPELDALAGWSQFVREEVREDPESVDEGKRLSDVLRMRFVGIRNAEIVYDDGSGEQPMTLRDITLDLNTPPGDEPGWYKLEGDLARPDLFAIALDGRVNLDTVVLELANLALEMNLGEPSYETLPPQLQELMREHEVRGALNSSVSGTIAISDWVTSKLNVNANLVDGFVSFGEYVFPLDRLQVGASMSGGSVTANYIGELLGGQVDGDATIGLEAPQPVQFSWQAKNIQIEDTLRVVSSGTPQYAGLLATNGEAEMEVDLGTDSLSGEGALRLRRGRLVALPVINDLVEVITGKGLLGGEAKMNDELDASFRLRPEFVRFTDLDLRSSVVAARGEGQVYYDGRLDMVFNAGPLEKAQSLLGDVGKVLGEITDKFVKYHVGGRVGDPKVGVKPLGIGAGDG